MDKTALIDVYHDRIEEFKTISGGLRLCFSIKTNRSRGLITYKMWVPYRDNKDILFYAKTTKPFIYCDIDMLLHPTASKLENFNHMINDNHAEAFLKLYDFIKSEFEEYKNGSET